MRPFATDDGLACNHAIDRGINWDGGLCRPID